MDFDDLEENEIRNVEKVCDICGEPGYDGLTQVAELYVCDNCYEDMQNEVEDCDWDNDE